MMPRPTLFWTLSVALLMTLPLLASGGAVEAEPLVLGEFVVDHDTMCQLRDGWVETLLATHEEGTWAPLRVDPTDDQLALLGLPSRDLLSGQTFDVPTAVHPDGTMVALSSTAVASFAGTGCLGIRPGAFLLLLDDGVGWCSLAHVYGSPGKYSVSTAGHCGKTGDSATVIAALGNSNIPVLLTFGQFATSRDGGVGNDWALITVDSQWQHLVSPTMCFWGGPLGMYEATGAVLAYQPPRGNKNPSLSVTPDPTLAQTVVHYGHGTAVGTGGTPRMGEAIHWDKAHFSFFGAITWGDSGSGSNALQGDELGGVNQAAGINTHIYVDPSLRTGLGYLAGTRATVVSGALADGQLAPYPLPLPGAP